MSRLHNLKELRERRKELRLKPTLQEEKLWWYLRNKKLGIKFRRQHSVGGYILDFYCPEKNLIIELDGGVHNKKEAREYDKIRDKFLTNLGYQMLRIPNDEVDNSVEKVLDKIRYMISV